MMSERVETNQIKIDDITSEELRLSYTEVEKTKQAFLYWRQELTKAEATMNSKLRMIFALNNKEFPKGGDIKLSPDGTTIIY